MKIVKDYLVYFIIFTSLLFLVDQIANPENTIQYSFVLGLVSSLFASCIFYLIEIFSSSRKTFNK